MVCAGYVAAVRVWGTSLWWDVELHICVQTGVLSVVVAGGCCVGCQWE